MTSSAALVDACGAGATDLVRSMLAAGADPDQRDARGRTPLHAACAAALRPAARAELVDLLLEAGAGPFARDDDGAPVQSREKATRARLAAARGADAPTPLVLFRGGEHPLLHWFVDAVPACAPLADKLCCVEFRAPDGPRWPTPFELVPETSPDVPFGVPIVLRLGTAWSRHEWMQALLLQRSDVQRWNVVGGPHNDARLDDCRRRLPRSREVLGLEDLRRKAPSGPRPVSATFDALDALLANRAEALGRTWAETRAPATVPRDAWRPGRSVFGPGEGHDRAVYEDSTDDLLEARAAYDPVADVLWGDVLAWNEVDEAYARSVLRRGWLQRLEDVAGTASVVADAHAHLRRWYAQQGVSEADQLRAALFSARFGRFHRWRGDAPAPTDGTGRELWVATRPVDELAAALSSPPALEGPTGPDRSAALGRLLLLLDRDLALPPFQARAREVWARVRPTVHREDVATLLRLDEARFASWVVPGATTAAACSSVVSALPSRA